VAIALMGGWRFGYFTLMTPIAIRDMILSAAEVLNPHMVGDRLFGDVACDLVAASGMRYQGMCIDTGSGTGFCAEHAAIAAMVTAGEYVIDRIVAVWRDEVGRLYVLPPCGRCREFIRHDTPDAIAHAHLHPPASRRRSTSPHVLLAPPPRQRVGTRQRRATCARRCWTSSSRSRTGVAGRP